MIERLTNQDAIKDAERRISELIAAHGEWFYTRDAGNVPTSLRKSEIDVHVSHGRLLFSCWTEKGTSVWRIAAWKWTGEKLLLEATRRMGVERALIELIPRASARHIAATVSAARRMAAERLAHLAGAILDGVKVERVGLSAGARLGQPGRYARILLRHRRERIALTGSVVAAENCDADALLSAALIWFMRIAERADAPYLQKLWLVIQPKCAEPVVQRLALLRDDLRRVISLYEIDDAWQKLTPVPSLKLVELWRETPKRFLRPAQTPISDWAARMLALAPDAIDVVRARHGETLRFHGLAFARVRRVLHTERAWFGLEGAHKRLLDDANWPECVKLVQELQEHRRAEAADHRHALYKAAPEAWLESLLRRDITQLDPGLIIAPLHAQFRTTQADRSRSRPIDLLALRRDGRLVVIELKISEDREHVLQGADYWRRVEAHRRRGHLTRARLFGEAEIADEPPLVYLVAPILRFHRAFPIIAKAIDPEIEIYRFDINEDWRAGVRVMRRTRVN